MEFSLFAEASRDLQAEADDRREALVRVAVQKEILPFLVLAQSDQEYIHRRALIADRMQAIADRCEAGLDAVTGAADRMYRRISEIRTTAAKEARQVTAEGEGSGPFS